MENQNHCLSIKQAKLFWQGVSFHSDNFLTRCVLSQWRFSDKVCLFAMKIFWRGVSFHGDSFLTGCVLLQRRFSDEVCPFVVKVFWWGVSLCSEGFGLSKVYLVMKIWKIKIIAWLLNKLSFFDKVCPFHSEGFLSRRVLSQWRFSDEVSPFAVTVFWQGVSFAMKVFWRGASFPCEGFLTRCVLL